MEKKDNFKVAIYIRYKFENNDISFEKETFLREYCKKNNYEIVKVYRDVEPMYEYYSNSISKIFSEEKPQYRKLVILDIEELSNRAATQHALYEVLRDRDVSICSIKDGIIGTDAIFNVSLKKKLNNKIRISDKIILEDSPF